MTAKDKADETKREGGIMSVSRIGLIAGLVAGLGLQLFPPPAGLSHEAWIVASLAVVIGSLLSRRACHLQRRQP